jgi:hypothetical protein
MPRPVCFLGSVQESEQLIDSWGFRVASFSVRSADERERMDKDSGVAGVSGLSQRDHEAAKTLRLWVRRKRGNRKLECSGCGRRVNEIVETCEREVRDLPSALSGLWDQGRESSAFAEQGALQQAF